MAVFILSGGGASSRLAPFKRALVLGCLALATAQAGRALPDAPKPKPERSGAAERLWLAEAATLAVLYTADFTMTARGLGEGCGPGCRMRETDPLFGRHPSNGRIAATAGALFVAHSLILRRTERSRHAWVRWAGRAGFAYLVVDEGRCIHSWVR